MFLEHLDIDVYGPHRRVSLGPLSPSLNVVFGDPGAGKTAVIAFLRSVMLGGSRWTTSTAGRVVWSDVDGLVVCRREVDGSPTGSLRVERLARDGRTVLGDRPVLTADRLPPVWFDAFVAPLRPSAKQIRIGLGAAERIGLQVVGGAEIAEDPQVRRRYDELSRELATLAPPRGSLVELESRRIHLNETLHRHSIEGPRLTTDRWSEERLRAEREFQVARREVEICTEDCRELERSRVSVREELARLANTPAATTRQYPIKADYRLQLEQLDERLMRWRRTLREVRALRDHVGDRATDLKLQTDVLQAGRDDRDLPHRPLQAVDDRVEDVRRRLDWLADRYGREFDNSLPEAHSLADLLRSARAELQEARETISHRQTIDSVQRYEEQSAQLARCEHELLAAIERLIGQRAQLLRRIADEYHVPTEQLSDAFGDWRSCEDHPHLYHWLFSEACPPRPQDNEAYQGRYRRLEGELADLEAELGRSQSRLDSARRDENHWALELEQRGRHRTPIATEDLDRPRWHAELVDVEAAIAVHQRRAHLLREHENLAARIRSRPERRVRPGRFCRNISEWLGRLSDGQLRHFAVARHEGSESVDGRSIDRLTMPELECLSLAIRLAVSDALASQGRPIPLVIDDPHDRLARNIVRHAAHGRQILLMTRRRDLIDNVLAAGGKALNLDSRYDERHAAPRYERSYEPRSAIEPESTSARPSWYVERSNYQPRTVHRVEEHYEYAVAPTRIYDVNRELDTAWRETYGLYDDPRWTESPRYVRSENSAPPSYGVPHYAVPRHERIVDTRLVPAPAPVPVHEPYYEPEAHYPNSYRVIPSPTRYENSYASNSNLFRDDESERRFFLTEESPVDQAPSVDAMIGSRLRGLGMHRVGELVTAEPGLLAERLCLSNVSGDNVRQWQDEARLVCTVPRLRPFDARVLVGCGVTDAQQLAAMHPTHLLQRVQSFLATDRGRHILNSGSSYELSRITNWIVSAGRTVPAQATLRSRAEVPDFVKRTRRSDYTAEELDARRLRRARAGSDIYRSVRPQRPEVDRRDRVGLHEEPLRERVRVEREVPVRIERVDDRDTARRVRVRTERPDGQRTREERAREDRPRRPAVRSEESSLDPRRNLRFYLNRRDSVVDAPTIGPSLARKLEAAGVVTVADLLDQSTESIARSLDLPRVTAEVIRQWQREASLACRVPELRGHDAQILVASGIYEPEQIAGFSAQQLFDRIVPFTRTADAKRILRGGTPPDVAEVANWIEWSRHSRTIAAA